MTELQATGNIGDDRETINANFTEAAAHAADTVKHVTAEDKAFWNDTGADLTGHMLDHNNPHEATAEQIGAIPASQKGAANGVATLDANSRVPLDNMPIGVVARVRNSMSAVGWHRIAQCDNFYTMNNIMIQLGLSTSKPETYLVSLCHRWEAINFATINCAVGIPQRIIKIRVCKSSINAGNGAAAYIDIFYNDSAPYASHAQIVDNLYANQIANTGFRPINFTPVDANPPTGYVASEYSLPNQSLEERIAALEGGI